MINEIYRYTFVLGSNNFQRPVLFLLLTSFLTAKTVMFRGGPKAAYYRSISKKRIIKYGTVLDVRI